MGAYTSPRSHFGPCSPEKLGNILIFKFPGGKIIITCVPFCRGPMVSDHLPLALDVCISVRKKVVSEVSCWRA